MARNRRRRLVTAVPELPLELVDRNGELAETISEISTAHCHGAKMPRVLGNLRQRLYTLCPQYHPAPNDENLFGDGNGLVCISGRAGCGVFRGKLCTKVCILGDSENDKRNSSDFVKVEKLIAAYGREPVIEALKAECQRRGEPIPVASAA